MGRYGAVDPGELTDLTLAGEQLELRPARPGDAGHDDPAGVRTRHADALKWALIELASGQVVGSATLSLDGDAVIGVRVVPDARARGHGAEAGRLVAAWAFAHGMPRVEARCDARDLAAARAALAAGFSFEGIVESTSRSAGRGEGPERQSDDARFGRTASADGGPVAAAFPPFPGGALGDGVITLRAARAEDAQGYFETDDDVSVGWSFDGEPHTYRRAQQAVARAELMWLVGREARCAIVDDATGRYAGELQLRLAGPPQVAELGYVVHPDFRGRGYTARAVRLLARWAFDTAGFVRLEAGAKADNIASQKAALAAGMHRDGVRAARLRNPDATFSDEICFALVDPAAQRPPISPSG